MTNNMFSKIKYLAICTTVLLNVACASEEYWDEKPLHASGANSEAVADKDDDVIRLVQYNVGAFRKSGGNSLVMIADMMKELGADVISLNEVDSCTTRTGKVNQLAHFTYEMGSWNYKFGKALDLQGGGYGVGVCYNPACQAQKSYAVTLPQSNDAETRAMAVVEFDKFIFASTHLGLTPEAQLAQWNTIRNWFDAKYPSTDKPIFLCGDFNAVASSELLTGIKKTWRLASTVGASTFPSTNPKKCIDYIIVRSSSDVNIVKTSVAKEFSSGTVSTASDHLPVYVDIKF